MAAIVVGTDERPWLEACLGTLLASRLPRARIHVTLVDNASADGTAGLVADRFPAVQVIRRPVRGHFSDASNLGIRAALERGADHVFLVNADTRTPPGLVQALVDFAERWPEYGVIGPLQYVYGDGRSPSRELNAWSRMALDAGEANVFVHTCPRRPPCAGPVEGRAPGTLEHAYVQGAAFFCRAAVLRDVGILDEVYGTYYEETDLCRRVRWAGWRVALVLDLGIEHRGEGATAGSRYRRRRMLRNKYLFLATDPEWSAADAVRLASRWLLDDLRRRGPAPAATPWAAVCDTVLGLLWLLGRAPTIARRRRAHARLLREGGGGPLRPTG